MTTDVDSDASDTKDDGSTSQASSGNTDTDATGSTSDTSVGSRRSSRTRKRRRNDDSLAEELEQKYKKSTTRKSTRKTKVKEVGVKPNPASEASRKVALNDAKRLAALLQQKEKLASKFSNAPSTSTSSTCNLVLGAGAKKILPGAALINASSSTPKAADDITPRKKKLIEENESLRRLLCQTTSQTENENLLDQSGNLHSNGNLSYSNDEENITVIHNTVDNNLQKDETDKNDNEDQTGGEHQKDENNTESTGKVKKDKKHRHQKKRKSKAKKKRKKRRSSKKSGRNKRRRHSSTSSSSSNTSSSSSTTSETSSVSEGERKKKRKRRKRRTKVRSEQLQYNSECSDVEEIMKGSGIYMKEGAVAALKRSARSHTAAARGFLLGVFTTNALKNCSLKGNPSKGPLGKTIQARPPLFGPGLDAVLGAARQLAKDKKFELMKDSVVNHELATKQSELRSVDKMKALLNANSNQDD